jgi:hypothetical protein
MVSTWIESSAKGRHGGPVRAGMWSTVVVGTHPVEADQEVWLEVLVDDGALSPLPAYWLENRGVNSLWHVPVPPQAVGQRLRYRSGARRSGGLTAYSPYQEVVVRPNPPAQGEPAAHALGVEGLVGNRHMTVRVDGRASTYDIYFPTTGLHSDVRPAEGDLPQSRTHFRAILGGLALGSRLEWFDERLAWEADQRYLGATNLLSTTLTWRHGPVRVVATDLVCTGPNLPRTAGGTESTGQYLKRFRIRNDGDAPRRALFGLFVHAEVNGGIGEPGLSWHDGDQTLLATNRGHGHANRKLARDATVEFAVAMDGAMEASCETTGPNEAMILRWVDLPAGGEATVDVLVSGAFTGWRGDLGTFEHWLRPALDWFRAADLDGIEREAAASWDAFVEPLPNLEFPKSVYAVTLRRSALGAALHADAKWGALASGYDLGLHAYCWPRDSLFAGLALGRAGHPEVARGVLEWIGRVRSHSRPYAYWFHKYTTDGWPEWESPAVDQSAMIPWAVERHYQRTGDLEFARACWPLVEQAAAVCAGQGGHPGLAWLDDLALVSSAGVWDNRYGAFLYSNAAVVAGLRASARLARMLDRPAPADDWEALAGRIWEVGILSECPPGSGGPGLVDPGTGRFLDARRLSVHRGLWTDRPEALLDRSDALDISLLGLVVPFGLLPADDPRVRRSAEALLASNVAKGDPNALTCWSADPARPESSLSPGEGHRYDPSSLATLWMARYLVQLARESGEAAHAARAVELIHSVVARLGPLGLALHVGSRRGWSPEPPRAMPGVWGLHAMLIDALLDLAGLDEDAPRRLVRLAPVPPPDWPSLGQSATLACGKLRYRFERLGAGAAGGFRLEVEAHLVSPVTLEVAVPAAAPVPHGAWTSEPASEPPRHDPDARQLRWAVQLPEGESRREWSWGEPESRPRRTLGAATNG